jgi:hypothetical protein
LKEQIPRPFIFGPIEFTGLDQPSFDGEQWRNIVQAQLEKSIQYPKAACIYGLSVTCKNRNLKRASTIVKHSRFMRNLIVKPNYPEPPKEVIAEASQEPEAQAE